MICHAVDVLCVLRICSVFPVDVDVQLIEGFHDLHGSVTVQTRARKPGDYDDIGDNREITTGGTR